MNIFLKFLNGDFQLWKSFWLIGFLHGFFIMYCLPLIEINFFSNIDIFNKIIINNVEINILDFNKITFISKLIIIISSLLITIGIWKSAEKYKGSFIIILITLIYLTLNNIVPLVFYLKKLFV